MKIKSPPIVQIPSPFTHVFRPSVDHPLFLTGSPSRPWLFTGNFCQAIHFLDNVVEVAFAGSNSSELVHPSFLLDQAGLASEARRIARADQTPDETGHLPLSGHSLPTKR